MISEIDAGIEVLAAFRGRSCQPRVFTWEGRRHDVRKITASWSEREGAHWRHYFAVETDGANIYELCFQTSDLSWRLLRIHCDG